MSSVSRHPSQNPSRRRRPEYLMTVLTRECCFSDFSIAIDDARGIGLSENRPLRRADGKLWMCSSFCFVFGVDGGGRGWV